MYEFASVKNIGQSLEGRDMNVLVLSKAGPGKPNVLIEAGNKSMASRHSRKMIA